MSKGPTPRHSKSPKPVTIDLDATDVTPKDEILKPKPSATGPSVARAADTTKPEETSSKAAGAQTKSDSSSKPTSDLKAGPAGTDTKAQETKTPDSKTTQSNDTKTQDTKPKAAASGMGSAASAKPAASTGKSGGGLGMVVSGVLGAVLALGGGYALQSNGMLPVPVGSGAEVGALASKIDVISTNVETLAGQVAESADGAVPDISAQLSARLDSLETGLTEATADGGGDGTDAAALAALEERLSGLEAKIAELGDAATETSADPTLVTEMTELRAAQSGIETSMSQLQSVTDALSGKITDLEKGQEELTQQVDAPSRQIDLARAIAAAGLKSAIDRGGSFMSELEAFATVAPDDPAVSELRDLAARGVPSRSGLVAGFSDAAAKAIAAAAPVDPEAGLVDRLMSSALSVVKVRKVGDVEGDSAEAIVARAEARLVNGDLDAAVTEWNALPETSRTAAADYGDALAARARTEKLIAAAMAPTGSAAASSTPSEVPAN